MESVEGRGGILPTPLFDNSVASRMSTHPFRDVIDLRGKKEALEQHLPTPMS